MWFVQFARGSTQYKKWFILLLHFHLSIVLLSAVDIDSFQIINNINNDHFTRSLSLPLGRRLFLWLKSNEISFRFGSVLHFDKIIKRYIYDKEWRRQWDKKRDKRIQRLNQNQRWAYGFMIINLGFCISNLCMHERERERKRSSILKLATYCSFYDIKRGRMRLISAWSCWAYASQSNHQSLRKRNGVWEYFMFEWF